MVGGATDIQGTASGLRGTVVTLNNVTVSLPDGVFSVQGIDLVDEMNGDRGITR